MVIAPLLVVVATAVAVTVGAPPAAAAVGPEECKFSDQPTGSEHTNVSRSMVCFSYTWRMEAINVSTGDVEGVMLAKVFQWYQLDPKSLKVTRSLIAKAYSATEILVPGVQVEATNPCLEAVPNGCTSNAPAQLINQPKFTMGTSFTYTWDETFQLASPSPTPRGIINDRLVFRARPVVPGSVPMPPVFESVNYDFWCDAVNATYHGCYNRAFDPTVTLDAEKNPLLAPVAHHIATAQGRLPDADPDTSFTLLGDPAESNANRDRHCAGNPDFRYDKPRNDACDDFPFAWVKQAASAKFSVMPVPQAAEAARDVTLTSFVLTNHLFAGDKFKVATKLTDARTGEPAPYAALTNQFNAYSNNATCADWSGGDATNSVRLPDGRRVWFFSDSFLGNPVIRRDPFGFSSVHNSIIVQNGSSMRTITGGNTCQEGNLSKDFWDRYAKTIAPAPDQGGFYWTGDQRLVDDNTVVKFYYHGKRSGDLWVNDYAAVARIPVSQFDNAVLTVQPTPMRCSTDPKVLWGTMTMEWTDGNVYVYGTGAVAPQRLYLARTTKANLASFGSWQFLSAADPSTGSASWSSGCAAAAALPIGLSPGGSVSNIDGTAWLVQDTANLINTAGGTIEAFPSSTPWGFSNRHIDLYLPPEAKHEYPHYYQVYEPRIQDKLTTGDNLVLSYNVNTSAVNTGCVSANNWDGRIYRPRFVTVPKSWFNQHDASVVGSGTAATVARTAAAASVIGDATDWYDHWGYPCPTVPAALNLTAAVGSNGSVSLDWQTQGSDVWTYLYQCDATTTACSSTSSCTADTGGFTKQYEGLWLTDSYRVHQPVTSAANNGHTFAWYVCSSGAQSGKGGPSNQVRAKVTLPVPSAPVNLRGSRSGTSISLTWNAVTFPNPSVYYTPYHWDITAGGTPANAVAGTPVTGTSLTLTVPNATHTYGFLLKASNIAGVGPPSNTITL